MKNKLPFILIVILFSCEKEIQLNIPNSGKDIVVQAMIQEGYPPIVQLTWSDSYFATIDSEAYDNLFVKGAEIVIFNHDRTDSITLMEIETLFPSLPLGALPGLYSDPKINIDTTALFPFNTFFSEGKKYHLRIIYENHTLTAITTIPHSTPLDSIWFISDERFPEYGDFYAYYNDPDTMGNNVMFEHKRLSHFSLKEEKNNPDFMFIKAFGGVRNDFEGLNGVGFETFFERGKDSKYVKKEFHEKHPSYGNFQTAYMNDTLSVPFADVVLFRFSQLDKASFEFWRTVIAQEMMNNNPFAEPLNLKSNINGGLGIFEGKASVYYKLIARDDTTFTERVYPNILDIL